MARLSNNAPVGSLMKADPPARDKKYLAAIRRLPCLICGTVPCREAAHVRMSFNTFGRKPSDYRTIPMCHRHHMQQHERGERDYWNFVGLDPLPIVEELNRAYPDEETMAAIILRAR